MSTTTTKRPKPDPRSFFVAGTQFCDGVENANLGVCTLLPEDHNKYDRDAVVIMQDGKKIGYVPRTLAPFIRHCLNNSFRITKIDPAQQYCEVQVTMSNATR